MTPEPALEPAGRWNRVRAFWRAPDETLAHAGARGELVVARVRLGVTALLFLAPALTLLADPTDRAHWIGFGIASAALLAALGVYLVVRREHTHRLVGPLCSLLDVSAVSAALALFLVIDQPLTAVNSRVTWEVYLLAIFATSLRYDARLCVLAGGAAMVQYAAIVGWAVTGWDLSAPEHALAGYGSFDWSTQVSRLVLLLGATVLSTAVVARAQRLRRLSLLDRMTGLHNRGYFDERLAAEMSRARRTQQPLSLVMIDVDHFKQFNDRYGHTAGDAGLRAVAALVRNMCRRSDLVARYGGEEFVIVMPETTADAAREKVEAIRVAVQRLPIRLPRVPEPVTLTVSAGVATCAADGVTGGDLLDAADARLFLAKQRGRNRVIGAADEDVLPLRWAPADGAMRSVRL